MNRSILPMIILLLAGFSVVPVHGMLSDKLDETKTKLGRLKQNLGLLSQSLRTLKATLQSPPAITGSSDGSSIPDPAIALAQAAEQQRLAQEQAALKAQQEAEAEQQRLAQEQADRAEQQRLVQEEANRIAREQAEEAKKQEYAKKLIETQKLKKILTEKVSQATRDYEQLEQDLEKKLDAEEALATTRIAKTILLEHRKEATNQLQDAKAKIAQAEKELKGVILLPSLTTEFRRTGAPKRRRPTNTTQDPKKDESQKAQADADAERITQEEAAKRVQNQADALKAQQYAERQQLAQEQTNKIASEQAETERLAQEQKALDAKIAAAQQNSTSFLITLFPDKNFSNTQEALKEVGSIWTGFQYTGKFNLDTFNTLANTTAENLKIFAECVGKEIKKDALVELYKASTKDTSLSQEQNLIYAYLTFHIDDYINDTKFIKGRIEAVFKQFPLSQKIDKSYLDATAQNKTFCFCLQACLTRILELSTRDDLKTKDTILALVNKRKASINKMLSIKIN